MRVLYVLGSFYPAQIGGPNNTILWQAKALQNAGHVVSVAALKLGLDEKLLSQHDIRLNHKSVIEGVETYFFDYSSNIYLCPKLYIWLWKNAKNYDRICLTSAFFPLTWFAAIVSILQGIPFNIAPRGELKENALRIGFYKKWLFWNLFLKRLYSHARFVLVTATDELLQTQKHFEPSTHFRLVPNYIDLSTRPELTVDKIASKRDILFVGRLHPIKAIDRLIAAYSLLPPNIALTNNLLIAGQGSDEYKGRLQAEAGKSKYQKNILFLGHVEGNGKEELYKNARVLVLPSHTENFGNVIIEALSCSTPVIASTNTPWESLAEKKCGAWIDNSPEAIAESLVEILSLDDSKYSELALNARSHVLQNYSIQSHQDEIERLIISAHTQSVLSDSNESEEAK